MNDYKRAVLEADIRADRAQVQKNKDIETAEELIDAYNDDTGGAYKGLTRHDRFAHAIAAAIGAARKESK